MRVRVIIFARVPYCGAVKTRLAKRLGAQKATRFYRFMLGQTIEAVMGEESYIAWTPDNVLWHQGVFALPPLTQGAGDLGKKLERLARKFAPVIFVGSDSLALNQAVIKSARLALRHNDVVVAPAGDGGYSLIGVRSGFVPAFKGVRWSHAETLSDTLRNLKHQRVCLLPPVPDIDEAEELDDALKQFGKITRLMA